MPIVQQGAINTTALIVPDIYVQIVPPQNLNLNGVPTDKLGIVGTAAWGPVNTPTIIGNMGQFASTFGAIQNRKYDLGTAAAIAVQQGAQNLCLVRVTDGTDTKASITIGSNGMTLTARYSGTLGNQISAVISAGTAANSWRLTVGLPNQQPEIYDNIVGSGNALWGAFVTAVNAGNGALRGPSQLITATVGSSTAAPVAGTYLFASGTAGTDGATPGASNVRAATLVGTDITTSVAAAGMYALRGQGCSVGMLADADDSTQWTYQTAFGLAEGLYMILTGPAGDNIANAVTTKASAGIDSYAAKLMFGDWLYWYDQVNQVTRLVSPQGFVAGRLANLSPQNSTLNRPLYGIQGSQKAGIVGSPQRQSYAAAELSALIGAGIDVIANPAPGGAYWAVRGGHNSASNAAVNGDNYTRMTNYLASTLNAGMGAFVGQTITLDLFRRIRGTMLAFLQAMLDQGMLGSTDGTKPFSVICDISNNPGARTSIGYVQADAQIRYLAINEKFIVNIEGGQSVVVAQGTNQRAG
jgi:hypothetical protein